MMSATIWGPLTVQEFFQGYNWRGEPPKLQPPETEPKNQGITSWLGLSVQDFLNQSNWRGQAILPKQEQPLTEKDPLSLTLSVAEFFGAGYWKGQKGTVSVKSTPKPLEKDVLSEDSQEYHLTDLSDLF